MGGGGGGGGGGEGVQAIWPYMKMMTKKRFWIGKCKQLLISISHCPELTPHIYPLFG